MCIRKFKKTDARQLSDLIKECLLKNNSKDYPETVITFMSNHFTSEQLIKNSKERDVFVAFEDEIILGTASLKENIILTVFVSPNIQNRGFGSKLMEKVENLAKENGYKEVKIPSSLTSLEFYKRRGYKKIKMLHSKEYGDTIEMRKILI